jgi:beta-phosphoglucomutase
MKGWSITEHSYNEEKAGQSESLFSIGNGYLGYRGFFCEREGSYRSGVFINGLYESSPITYGESAYGYAKNHQKIIDLPDARYFTITIDGEKFLFSDPKIIDYKKTLYFTTGILEFYATWRTHTDKEVTIKVETLISLEYRHIGALKLEITSNKEIDIEIYSSIDMPRPTDNAHFDPRAFSSTQQETLLLQSSRLFDEQEHSLPSFQATFETQNSHSTVVCSALHEHKGATLIHSKESPLPSYRWEVKNTTSYTFTKYLYYTTQGRLGEQEYPQTLSSTTPFIRWETLVKEQRQHCDQFWSTSDLIIEGDDELQLAVRHNLFHLFQSAGRDGYSSLSAKGLSGNGYDGHYFWDTEMYVIPLFIHTNPSIARSLLMYRIHTLTEAKQRAGELHHKGALFPWRTINGEEASAYYPAGTAQYHINGAIAYALSQYLTITQDQSLLEEGALELFIETARFWYDLGFFNEHKDYQFCIHKVTGPDEYSAVVNNNAYTNLIAQFHLSYVVSLITDLKKTHPHFVQRVTQNLKLSDEELHLFDQAAKKMYIPFDNKEGITLQDDQFLELEKWDESKKGPRKNPMLLYYHPLTIYRHKVIKQADVVLAGVLFGESIPWYQRKRNYDYYEQYTTGDSSLSASIHALEAFRLGYEQKALHYIHQAAYVDLKDLHSNTKDGLHVASQAGSWMAIIYGLAGYYYKDGVAHFAPRLPSSWKRLSFHLQLGSSLLEVNITHTQCEYRCSGPKVTISHFSDSYIVDDKGVMSPTSPRCKAVIFDLDGVITSTDYYHYLGWKYISDKKGWAFDEKVNQQLRGVGREDSLKIIAKSNNVTLTQEEVTTLCDMKNEKYVSLLEQLDSSHILGGIVQLLKEVRKANLGTALASVSKNGPLIVEKLGLTPYFDAIVDASSLIKGKPDPEIFIKASELLHLHPRECTAVEDAASGIEAIRHSQMKVVGVGDAIDPQLCDVYVESTDQLTLEMVSF